jgi:hypothetical protein
LWHLAIVPSGQIVLEGRGGERVNPLNLNNFHFRRILVPIFWPNFFTLFRY